MRNLPFKIALTTAILCATSMTAPINSANAQDAPAPNVPALEKPLAPDAVGEAFETMMGAIEDGNRLVFIAAGDASFKAAITPALFKSVVDTLAFRLEAGHEMLYLGDLKRGGASVYLWRVRYKDEGDDTLAEMSWKDGKVIGILIH